MLVPGEEHAYCKALVEAHKECLRSEGFKVSAGSGAVQAGRGMQAGACRRLACRGVACREMYSGDWRAGEQWAGEASEQAFIPRAHARIRSDETAMHACMHGQWAVAIGLLLPCLLPRSLTMPQAPCCCPWETLRTGGTAASTACLAAALPGRRSESARPCGQQGSKA